MIIRIAQFELRSVHTKEVIAIHAHVQETEFAV